MRTLLFAVALAVVAVGCRIEPRLPETAPAAEAPPPATPPSAAPFPSAQTAADGKPEVVLYVTEWCPYCRQARDYMTAENVPHRVVDIEKDAAGAQEYVALGGDGGIPLVAVGREVMNGWSPEAARGMLDNAGYE